MKDNNDIKPNIFMDLTSPRNKRLLRVIAFVLIVAFVHQDIVWAQGGTPIWSKPVTTSEKLGEKLGTVPKGDCPNFSIPKDVAVTKEVYNSSGSPKTIINIQDAHASLSAQESISSILDSLVTNYDLKLVAIEGSSGYIDTSILKTFPDEAIRKDTAKTLMSQGKMSAGAFFAITSNKPVALYGIEDKDLYLENVDQFRRVYELNQSTKKDIDKLIKVLNELKDKLYTPELRQIESNSVLHEDGKITFTARWELVRALASKYNIDYKEYSNLSKLVESLKLEKDINFTTANKERDSLIDELSKKLNKNNLEELVLKSLSFKTNKITQGEYYTYLQDLANKANIDPNPYKNLINYTSYITIYESIDLLEIFTEVKHYEDTIIEKLYTTPDQKKLHDIAKLINHIKDLFELKLTNSDFEYLEKHVKTCNKAYIQTILTGPVREGYDLDKIFNNLDVAMNFYRTAEKRNQTILSNTIKRMDAEGTEVAALITGGYHTKGISDLLKAKQTSYLVILPKFDASKGERPYVAILTNKKDDYSGLIESGKYRVMADEYIKNSLNDPKQIEKFVEDIVYTSLNKAVKDGKDVDSLKSLWKNSYRASYEDLKAKGLIKYTIEFGGKNVIQNNANPNSNLGDSNIAIMENLPQGGGAVGPASMDVKIDSFETPFHSKPAPQGEEAWRKGIESRVQAVEDSAAVKNIVDRIVDLNGTMADYDRVCRALDIPEQQKESVKARVEKELAALQELKNQKAKESHAAVGAPAAPLKYEELISDTTRLADVDGVIADFDGVDRIQRPGDETGKLIGFYPPEIVNLKAALTRHGIVNVTLTGEQTHLFLEKVGGTEVIARQAAEGRPYYFLTRSGAVGQLVRHDGTVEAIPNYEEASLGDQKIADEILDIALKAARRVVKEEGLESIVTEDDFRIMRKGSSSQGVSLYVGDVPALQKYRFRVAEFVRQEVENMKMHGRLPATTEVVASFGAVDVMPRSKGTSAIEMIKRFQLRRVVLLADSIGTAANPGNDRSMLALTQDELKAAGIDWDVDLIKIYVGHESNAEVPPGVYVAVLRDGMITPSVDVYEAVVKAKESQAAVVTPSISAPQPAPAKKLEKTTMPHKDMVIQSLTKEFAEAHKTKLLYLHNLIMGSPWTEESQITDDVWSTKDYPWLKEDRPFPGKWQHSFVAVDEKGAPVGFLIAYERKDYEYTGFDGKNAKLDNPMLFIHVLAVDENYRKHGIGTELLRQTAQHLQNRGFVELGNGYTGPLPMILQTKKYNTQAQSVYEKAGFEKIGTTGEDYVYAVDSLKLLNMTAVPAIGPAHKGIDRKGSIFPYYMIVLAVASGVSTLITYYIRYGRLPIEHAGLIAWIALFAVGIFYTWHKLFPYDWAIFKTTNMRKVEGSQAVLGKILRGETDVSRDELLLAVTNLISTRMTEERRYVRRWATDTLWYLNRHTGGMVRSILRQILRDNKEDEKVKAEIERIMTEFGWGWGFFRVGILALVSVGVLIYLYFSGNPAILAKIGLGFAVVGAAIDWSKVTDPKSLTSPLEKMIETEKKIELGKAISRLGKREQAALGYRFWHGMSYEQAGILLGVSSRRARYIVLKATQRLKNYFFAKLNNAEKKEQLETMLKKPPVVKKLLIFFVLSAAGLVYGYLSGNSALAQTAALGFAVLGMAYMGNGEGQIEEQPERKEVAEGQGDIEPRTEKTAQTIKDELANKIKDEQTLIDAFRKNLPDAAQIEPIPDKFITKCLTAMFTERHILRDHDKLQDEISDLWHLYLKAKQAQKEGRDTYYLGLNDINRVFSNTLSCTQIFIVTPNREGVQETIGGKIRKQKLNINDSPFLIISENDNDPGVCISLYQLQQSSVRRTALSEEAVNSLFASFDNKEVCDLARAKMVKQAALKSAEKLLHGIHKCDSNGILRGVWDGMIYDCEDALKRIELGLESDGLTFDYRLGGMRGWSVKNESSHLNSILEPLIADYYRAEAKSRDNARKARERRDKRAADKAENAASMTHAIGQITADIFRVVKIERGSRSVAFQLKEYYDKYILPFARKGIGEDKGESFDALFKRLIKRLGKGYMIKQEEVDQEERKFFKCFEAVYNKLPGTGETRSVADTILKSTTYRIRKHNYTARFAMWQWLDENYPKNDKGERPIEGKSAENIVVEVSLKLDMEEIMFEDLDELIASLKDSPREIVLLSRKPIRDEQVFRTLIEKYGIKTFIYCKGGTKDHLSVVAQAHDAIVIVDLPEMVFNRLVKSANSNEGISVYRSEVDDSAYVYVGQSHTESADIVATKIFKSGALNDYYDKKQKGTKDKIAITNDKPEEDRVGIPVYGNVHITRYFKKWGDEEGVEKAIKALYEHGANGIGLGRTEYMYNDPDVPSFKEQFKLYRQIADMEKKPVTLRTYDKRDDKECPSLPYVPDTYSFDYYRAVTNPATGEKAGEEALFWQVSAMLGACVSSKNKNIEIMFPMVKTVEDMKFLADIIARAKEMQKVKYRASASDLDAVSFGIMVEDKEAIKNLAALLDNPYVEIGFVSIGTNDLISSVKPIPRSEQTSKDFDKEIMSIVEDVLRECAKRNIPVTMCGDASRLDKTLFLSVYDRREYGMPIIPSVAASFVPKVKSHIEAINSTNCHEMFRNWRARSNDEINVMVQEKADKIIGRIEKEQLFRELLRLKMSRGLSHGATPATLGIVKQALDKFGDRYLGIKLGWLYNRFTAPWPEELFKVGLPLYVNSPTLGLVLGIIFFILHVLNKEAPPQAAGKNIFVKWYLTLKSLTTFSEFFYYLLAPFFVTLIGFQFLYTGDLQTAILWHFWTNVGVTILNGLHRAWEVLCKGEIETHPLLSPATISPTGDDGFIRQGLKSKKVFERKTGTLYSAEYTEKIVGPRGLRHIIPFVEKICARQGLTGARKARLNLLRHLLQKKNCVVYTFNGIVKGPDDFFLGHEVLNMRDQGDIELYLAADLIKELENRGPPTLVDEYILHELLCPILGHYRSIIIQQKLFPKHYKTGNFVERNGIKYLPGHAGEFDKPFKGLLGERVRGFIDKKWYARLDRGVNKLVNYLNDVRSVLPAAAGLIIDRLREWSAQTLNGAPLDSLDIAEVENNFQDSIRALGMIVDGLKETTEEIKIAVSNRLMKITGSNAKIIGLIFYDIFIRIYGSLAFLRDTLLNYYPSSIFSQTELNKSEKLAVITDSVKKLELAISHTERLIRQVSASRKFLTIFLAAILVPMMMGAGWTNGQFNLGGAVTMTSALTTLVVLGAIWSSQPRKFGMSAFLEKQVEALIQLHIERLEDLAEEDLSGYNRTRIVYGISLEIDKNGNIVRNHLNKDGDIIDTEPLANLNSRQIAALSTRLFQAMGIKDKKPDQVRTRQGRLLVDIKGRLIDFESDAQDGELQTLYSQIRKIAGEMTIHLPVLLEFDGPDIKNLRKVLITIPEEGLRPAGYVTEKLADNNLRQLDSLRQRDEKRLGEVDDLSRIPVDPNEVAPVDASNRVSFDNGVTDAVIWQSPNGNIHLLEENFIPKKDSSRLFSTFSEFVFNPDGELIEICWLNWHFEYYIFHKDLPPGSRQTPVIDTLEDINALPEAIRSAAREFYRKVRKNALGKMEQWYHMAPIDMTYDSLTEFHERGDVFYEEAEKQLGLLERWEVSNKNAIADNRELQNNLQKIKKTLKGFTDEHTAKQKQESNRGGFDRIMPLILAAAITLLAPSVASAMGHVPLTSFGFMASAASPDGHVRAIDVMSLTATIAALASVGAIAAIIMGLFQKAFKFFYGNTGAFKNGAQSPGFNARRTVQGHDYPAGQVLGVGKNNMASSLAPDDESGFFQGPHNALARNLRQAGHIQADTSISSRKTSESGTGKLSSFRDWIYNAAASFALATVSSIVSPWVVHPDKAGIYAEKPPEGSFSTINLNLYIKHLLHFNYSRFFAKSQGKESASSTGRGWFGGRIAPLILAAAILFFAPSIASAMGHVPLTSFGYMASAASPGVNTGQDPLEWIKIIHTTLNSGFKDILSAVGLSPEYSSTAAVVTMIIVAAIVLRIVVSIIKDVIRVAKSVMKFVIPAAAIFLAITYWPEIITFVSKMIDSFTIPGKPVQQPSHGLFGAAIAIFASLPILGAAFFYKLNETTKTDKAEFLQTCDRLASGRFELDDYMKPENDEFVKLCNATLSDKAGAVPDAGTIETLVKTFVSRWKNTWQAGGTRVPNALHIIAESGDAWLNNLPPLYLAAWTKIAAWAKEHPANISEEAWENIAEKAFVELLEEHVRISQEKAAFFDIFIGEAGIEEIWSMPTMFYEVHIAGHGNDFFTKKGSNITDCALRGTVIGLLTSDSGKDYIRIDQPLHKEAYLKRKLGKAQLNKEDEALYETLIIDDIVRTLSIMARAGKASLNKAVVFTDELKGIFARNKIELPADATIGDVLGRPRTGSKILKPQAVQPISRKAASTAVVEGVVVNENPKLGKGLHANMAVRIATIAASFKGTKVTIINPKNGLSANAVSMFDLLLLAIDQGDEAIIEADGPDAEMAVKVIKNIMRRGEEASGNGALNNGIGRIAPLILAAILVPMMMGANWPGAQIGTVAIAGAIAMIPVLAIVGMAYFGKKMRIWSKTLSAILIIALPIGYIVGRFLSTASPKEEMQKVKISIKEPVKNTKKLVEEKPVPEKPIIQARPSIDYMGLPKVVHTDDLVEFLVRTIFEMREAGDDSPEKLPGGMKIIRGVSHEKIKESIEVSNGPEYRKIVNNIYNFLIENKIMEPNDRIAVLFLEELPSGVATVYHGKDKSVLVLSKEDFELRDDPSYLSKMQRFLNIIFSHEISHLITRRKNPDISSIESEMIAYKSDMKVMGLLKYGEDTIRVTQLKYKAFDILLKNKKEIRRRFDVDEKGFKNVHYVGIAVDEGERYVKIVLVLNSKKIDFYVDLQKERILGEEEELTILQNVQRILAKEIREGNYGTMLVRLEAESNPGESPNLAIVTSLSYAESLISKFTPLVLAAAITLLAPSVVSAMGHVPLTSFGFMASAAWPADAPFVSISGLAIATAIGVTARLAGSFMNQKIRGRPIDWREMKYWAVEGTVFLGFVAYGLWFPILNHFITNKVLWVALDLGVFAPLVLLPIDFYIQQLLKNKVSFDLRSVISKIIRIAVKPWTIFKPIYEFYKGILKSLTIISSINFAYFAVVLYLGRTFLPEYIVWVDAVAVIIWSGFLLYVLESRTFFSNAKSIIAAIIVLIRRSLHVKREKASDGELLRNAYGYYHDGIRYFEKNDYIGAMISFDKAIMIYLKFMKSSPRPMPRLTRQLKEMLWRISEIRNYIGRLEQADEENYSVYIGRWSRVNERLLECIELSASLDKPDVIIAIPLKAPKEMEGAIEKAVENRVKVTRYALEFDAETRKGIPGIMLTEGVTPDYVKSEDFKLYVKAIQTIAVDKNGEKLRRFINFLKKKLQLMDKFDIDQARKAIDQLDNKDVFMARMQKALTGRLIRQKDLIKRAYNNMALPEGQFNNEVAIATTDKVVDNDISFFENIIKASEKGIVSPIIFGDTIKTRRDAESFARAGLKAIGIDDAKINSVMKSIIFINKSGQAGNRRSYIDIVEEIKSEAYNRLGTMISVDNIGIRSVEKELLADNETPAVGKLIEIQSITINGVNTYVSINTYQILLRVVTQLKGKMTLEGLGIPGLKIDERGRIIFTSPIVPYDYNKKIGAYRDAIILLASAA